MTLLATLAVVVAGVLAAKAWLDRGGALSSWPAALVLGPAVGFGGLSLVYFLWRLVGLPSAGFGLPAWGLLLATMVIAGRSVMGSPPSDAAARVSARAAATPILASAVALAGAAGGLLLAAVVFYARQMPFGTFDAVAIWTARARLLHLGGELPQLLGLVRDGHPDYPLLLPGSLAAQFAMSGSLDPLQTQATGALFSIAAVAAVTLGVIRLGGQRRWAWLAGALLATTPRFLYWGASQCADVPMSYFWVLTVTALATLVGGARPLVPASMAGFLLGLLAWTKNEGLPLTALLLGLYCVAALWTRRRSTLPPLLLGALPVWLGLALFRVLWKPKTDLHFFVGDLISRVLEPGRWRTVAEAFAERLLPWRGFEDWGLVWPTAAVLLVVGIAFARPASPALGAARWAAAFCWIAWFGIFVGTPVDLEWHLRTALDRLLLQLLPLTLMVTCAGLVARPPGTDAT